MDVKATTIILGVGSELEWGVRNNLTLGYMIKKSVIKPIFLFFRKTYICEK